MELETNINEFVGKIDSFGALGEQRQKQLIQGTTTEAHTFIFDHTPWRTGESARGWHFEVSQPFLGLVWNNLRWIRKLEHGSSRLPGKSGPGGFMIQSALLHAEELIRRAAAKLGIELR